MRGGRAGWASGWASGSAVGRGRRRWASGSASAVVAWASRSAWASASGSAWASGLLVGVGLLGRRGSRRGLLPPAPAPPGPARRPPPGPGPPPRPAASACGLRGGGRRLGGRLLERGLALLGQADADPLRARRARRSGRPWSAEIDSRLRRRRGLRGLGGGVAGLPRPRPRRPRPARRPGSAVDAVTSATAEEAMKESYWWSSASEVLPIVTVRSISDSIPSASTTAARPWTWGLLVGPDDRGGVELALRSTSLARCVGGGLGLVGVLARACSARQRAPFHASAAWAAVSPARLERRGWRGSGRPGRRRRRAPWRRPGPSRLRRRPRSASGRRRRTPRGRRPRPVRRPARPRSPSATSYAGVARGRAVERRARGSLEGLGPVRLPLRTGNSRHVSELSSHWEHFPQHFHRRPACRLANYIGVVL